MRRGIILTMIIVLVLSVGLLACACDGTPNNEDLQVLDWQEYLYRVAVAIDLQFLGVDVTKDVNCDFEIDVDDLESGDKYECILKLNLNLQGRDQQGLIKIQKVKDDDRQTVLQIFNEDDLYLLKYDEATGEYTRTRFDNSPFLYTIIKFVGGFGENINYSTVGGAFISLGKVFFTDATANADRSVYTFDFDLKKGLDSTIVRDTFAKLPKVLQKLFFSLAGVENYEDMLSKTPSIKGKINFATKDGKLSAISSEEIAYQKGNTSKTVKFEMPIISLSNGKSEDIENYRPSNEEYGNGRLSDLTSIGTVKLQNTNSKRTEMQYDYELRAKLDWVNLLAEGGDLNKLADDNFFHIKVSHRCDDNCSAFCKDKYDPAKGAILDVAFSPTDFGTHDVYISIGIRALIGSRVTSQLFNISEALVRSMIPEYWLTVVSANTLTRQATSTSQVNAEDKDGKYFFEELLIALMYEEGAISAPIEKLLEIIGMTQQERDTVMSIFSCDEYQIDTVTLEQSYYRWNVSPYDVKRSAIHLYGNDISGTKQYTKGFISSPPALTYECERSGVTDGENTLDVVKLYNDQYVSGILHDANTPISTDEIEKLIGSYAHATAEDIYGNTFDTQLYVAGHSTIDRKNTGWQRVELYCMPTGRGYFDSKLWETIRGYSWSKWFCITLTTYIKLDELEDVDYLRPEKLQYMQGERLITDDTPEQITAVLNYSSGKSKSIYVSATNKDEVLLLDNVGNRYIGADKNIMLQFYLFGMYYGYLLNITPAKSVNLFTTSEELSLEISEAGYTSQLRVGKLSFTLADGSTNELTLSMDSIKINGYKLNESNEYFYVNPTSFTGAIVMRSTGRYTLTFSYLGLEKSIPLYILPKSEKRDESKYQLENTTTLNSHYFEGYSYSFSANISNSYHGEWGTTSAVTVQVLRGYITSSGTLAYREPDDTATYFNISDIAVNGVYVDNDYLLELPATIYGTLPVRTRIQFLKSGYYKVRIKLGSIYCEQEVLIEKVFE